MRICQKGGENNRINITKKNQTINNENFFFYTIVKILFKISATIKLMYFNDISKISKFFFLLVILV